MNTSLTIKVSRPSVAVWRKPASAGTPSSASQVTAPPLGKSEKSPSTGTTWATRARDAAVATTLASG